MTAMKDFADYLSQIQAGGEVDILKLMLETMAKAVMDAGVAQHLGADRHERTEGRKGHRNGYKSRTLKTRVGELELDVPQVRGTEPYSPLFFAKWGRSERALLVSCAEMYFMGVSTRKVKHVLKKMGGFSLSASTVSCVAQELDEKLSEFRERRLDEREWPALMVDACYVKVRSHGRVRKQAVLVVAGINDDGRREILTWRLADVESEDTWTEVFRELRQRGVTGVELVVSDGHQGIQAAVTTQWPQATWQRCWTHFQRNALAKVGQKHKKALADELRSARKIEDVRISLAEAERVAARWDKQYPQVAKQIRAQFEETLATHDLPNTCRRRVYTTNMIERVMAEIKRRTNVVGIFPNAASADRLIGAHLLERHETWACERARYLTMNWLDDRQARQKKRKVA
jgi:transposase-like protein